MTSLIQRNGTVTMPPTTVTGSRPGPIEETVPGVAALSGQGEASSVEMGYTAETIQTNSPVSNHVLPFTESGWNAEEILTRLGQYDMIATTDSDRNRCVQAVALASRIPSGPGAVTAYLSGMVADAMLRFPVTDRRRAAFAVIQQVRSRIDARRATYGDLSWAQEAVHDMYYTDTAGTPGTGEAVREQIGGGVFGSLGQTTEPLDVWCTAPDQVMRYAADLPPGGQLITTFWKVIFNSAFDELEESGVATQRSMVVNSGGRDVRITRIDTNTRPAHTRIDPVRDAKRGHQMLIMKDNTAAGPLRLYEPEITDTGRHLISLSANGAELADYLDADATNGIYEYIQLMGRVIPSRPLTFGTTP